MTDPTIVIVQLCLTAVTALLTLVPVFYKMKAQREREQASSAHELTESAMSMVEKWEARATELDCRLRKLEKEVRYLRRGVGELIRQIVDAGMTPVFDPNGGPSRDEEVAP